MTKKFLTLSTAALAAAITLAGCGGGSGSGTTTTGMDHGSASATASASARSGSASASAAAHNSADTMFAQMMIPHHAQAVEMSDVILKKQNVPAKVTALAEKIKAAQAPEIETMTGWLKSWNEPTEAPGGHDMSSHGAMGGMMSADDMKKLDAAQGTQAAKLFLTQMIAHHQGAIMMANVEKDGGQNPDAVALAGNISTAQQKEIQEMKDLLAAL
ncbi:DUF305 domain-containing protein [Arthrobacter sp. NPDC058097]|uniref:DUF305 domain-containing protein n=1 Tax=Arthrobacter sp. NPDC058097 TaxID=3346340 RepID=UPI0036DF0493